MDRELSVTIKRKISQNKIYEVVRGGCEKREPERSEGAPQEKFMRSTRSEATRGRSNYVGRNLLTKSKTPTISHRDKVGAAAFLMFSSIPLHT